MPEKKIAIVGAGPAGLTAAELLAKSGFAVTLFDPKVPWEKPCGGLLRGKALDEFSILKGFRDDLKIECNGILFESPSGERVYKKFNESFYSVSRVKLGAFLLNRAVEAGAKLIPERVCAIIKSPHPFIVQTKKNSYKFDIIIGADGVNSLVRRSFSKRLGKTYLALTCGYLISGLKSKEFTIKYFDSEFYIWIFPRPDHTSAGIAARWGSEKVKFLLMKLDDYLNKNTRFDNKLAEWTALIPSINNPDFFSIPCSGENWMLIGDAAGHVNPASGEGLYYAFKSGIIAAEKIIEGNLSTYDTLWKTSYGKNLIGLAQHMKKVGELGEHMKKEAIGTIMFNNSVHIP